MLTLILESVDPTLDPALVRKIAAGIRNVRLTPTGYLIRGQGQRDDWPDYDWRWIYRRWFNRLFPQGWVYGGGHHLAIHASPPPPPELRQPGQDAGAGRCLFRILEARKLHPLACGRHWGRSPGGRCAKCSSGLTQRDLATAANRSLFSAVSYFPASC